MKVHIIYKFQDMKWLKHLFHFQVWFDLKLGPFHLRLEFDFLKKMACLQTKNPEIMADNLRPIY